MESSGDENNNDNGPPPSKTTCIDDNDVTVDYQGNWQLNLNESLVGDETTHSTSDPNASAFLSFFGTQIQVQGDFPIGEGTLAANYTIDNGEPSLKIVPTLGGNTSLSGQMLFESVILPSGPHNITITVVNASGNRNYTFTQFIITSGPSGQSDGTENNVGATVGGSVGAVIFLLLSAGMLYLWKKRRYNRRLRNLASRNLLDPEKSSVESLQINSVPDPYILNPLPKHGLVAAPNPAEEPFEPTIGNGNPSASTELVSSMGTRHVSLANSVWSRSETVVADWNEAPSRMRNFDNGEDLLQKYREMTSAVRT